MEPVTLRAAGPADAASLYRLMCGLAENQGEAAYLAATPASLAEALAAEPPAFGCLLAERDGRDVGYLTWVRCYGIWRGADYLNLDDLFVDESVRGLGVGAALMRRLGQLAAGQGIGARWEVQSDNLGARRFYARLGADQEDKTIVRWSVAAMRSSD